MLRFTCFVLLATLAVGLELSTSINNHWESFKSKHGKDYDSATESQRKEAFKSNVEAVLSHNLEADLGLKSFTLGINEHSDLSEDDFRSKFLGLIYVETNSSSQSLEAQEPLKEIPESHDWTSYTSVVKNQRSCGSCWSFAATGAIEAHLAIYQNKRVTLSEQNLVDCADKKFFNFGCNGGNPTGAYRYIIKNGGIVSDTCYPYEMKEGTCRYDEGCNTATIVDYKELPKHENKLMNVLATIGPLAVGIDAGQRSFQLYKNGVYDDSKCTSKVNHAVLVVGYGTEGGKPYYLVKNSWGPTWGENGYFKLFRGSNFCGITTMASYPIVAGNPAA